MASDAKDVRQQAHTKIRTQIVAALEKEFGIEQTPGLQIEFGNHTDTWLSIPPDFSKSELSDDERKAVAGRSIMIRWDILKGKFLPEAEPGELMLIGFGTFPAKFI